VDKIQVKLKSANKSGTVLNRYGISHNSA